MLDSWRRAHTMPISAPSTRSRGTGRASTSVTSSPRPAARGGDLGADEPGADDQHPRRTGLEVGPQGQGVVEGAHHVDAVEAVGARAGGGPPRRWPRPGRPRRASRSRRRAPPPSACGRRRRRRRPGGPSRRSRPRSSVDRRQHQPLGLPVAGAAPASTAAAGRRGCAGRRRAARSSPSNPSWRRVRAACSPGEGRADDGDGLGHGSRCGVAAGGAGRRRRRVSPRRSRWPASGSAARPPRPWPAIDSGGVSSRT